MALVYQQKRGWTSPLHCWNGHAVLSRTGRGSSQVPMGISWEPARVQAATAPLLPYQQSQTRWKSVQQVVTTLYEKQFSSNCSVAEDASYQPKQLLCWIIKKAYLMVATGFGYLKHVQHLFKCLPTSFHLCASSLIFLSCILLSYIFSSFSWITCTCRIMNNSNCIGRRQYCPDSVRKEDLHPEKRSI